MTQSASTVWRRQIGPLIEEYFFDQPDIAVRVRPRAILAGSSGANRGARRISRSQPSPRAQRGRRAQHRWPSCVRQDLVGRSRSARGSKRGPCMSHGQRRWSVRVGDAVGLLSIGDLQLEVRPKIPMSPSPLPLRRVGPVPSPGRAVRSGDDGHIALGTRREVVPRRDGGLSPQRLDARLSGVFRLAQSRYAGASIPCARSRLKLGRPRGAL